MTEPRGVNRAALAVDDEPTERTVAILSLSSGECVRIEGSDAETVQHLTQAFADSSVKWLRVGSNESVERELIREARHQPPNVVVLVSAHDWVCGISKARAHYGGTPILAVSSSSSSELSALSAGAASFCAIPADLGLFEARLRAVVRLRESSTFPVAAVEAVELSASSRLLRVADMTVHLSPAEYALIELLLERKDEWVSKEALWKALARESSGHDSSLLRMHTMQVRKKLGDARWMLQSQRGKGMMLTTLPIYKTLPRREP